MPDGQAAEWEEDVMTGRTFKVAVDVIVVAALLFLFARLGCGCASFARWQARQERRAFVRDVRYVRDPRTGICFAHHRLGGIAAVDARHCEKRRRP